GLRAQRDAPRGAGADGGRLAGGVFRGRRGDGEELPVSKPGAKKARLGEALVAQGVITQEQLDRALNEQKDSGQLLGEMLVEQNVIGAATLVHTLAKT